MYDKLIGQDRIIRELHAITYGLRKRPTESISLLFTGPAGYGKTEFAKTFCEEISYPLTYDYLMPEASGVIRGFHTNMRAHVIDEVHLVNSFEPLYDLMLSHVFCFCTTELRDLPEPFISRCIHYHIQNYTDEEIAKIVLNYALELRFNISIDTARLVAERARGTPRIGKMLLKRMKYNIDANFEPLTLDGVRNVYDSIGIFDGGYTENDVRYMEFLSAHSPSSLVTISRALRMEQQVIQEDVEPFLLEKGHIIITNKGRQFISWNAEED